jgi:L-cysteine S-thiosulfotransferase
MKWRPGHSLLLLFVGCASAAVAQDTGDARRGEAIVRDRAVGLCLLCHSGPFPDERFQGNLAPPLDGVGARLTPKQLRERMEDSRRINPESIMPAYARSTGYNQVMRGFEGKPILNAAQIADVVAFLATLR